MSVAEKLSVRVRVLVVAEVRLYREGLVQALAREAAIEIVGGVADAVGIADRAHGCQSDVVVMDAAVGIAARAVHELASAGARPRIVALGLREDEDDIAAWAAAGIAGFVSREAS